MDKLSGEDRARLDAMVDNAVLWRDVGTHNALIRALARCMGRDKLRPLLRPASTEEQEFDYEGEDGR